MRPIDADKLISSLNGVIESGMTGNKVKACLKFAIQIVDSQPTVDAVEVVRCKDCKFNYANQIPSENDCQLCVELPISDEFYCAYGEREDEVEK